MALRVAASANSEAAQRGAESYPQELGPLLRQQERPVQRQPRSPPAGLHLPLPENRIYLGDFAYCTSAVTEARKHYRQVNGCYFCSKPCHTS